MPAKIKKGSKVIVISGDDKGKEGIVLDMLPKMNKKHGNRRIIISGINLKKRHLKPRGNETGKIVEQEMHIHISNVKLMQ